MRRRISLPTAICVLACLGAAAYSQNISTSPSPSNGTSTSSNTMSGTTVSPAPMVAQPNSFLLGTWKVERAIFEYFGNIKEVTGIDDRFFGDISFVSAGKGQALYAGKPDKSEMEWDLKDGQNLTLAFGSRLKPQVDLYKLLTLGDGAIFLRSTRLANSNGTIIYILRKVN